jgi:hypothetical protein
MTQQVLTREMVQVLSLGQELYLSRDEGSSLFHLRAEVDLVTQGGHGGCLVRIKRVISAGTNQYRREGGTMVADFCDLTIEIPNCPNCDYGLKFKGGHGWGCDKCQRIWKMKELMIPKEEGNV